jgi:hypothetical protein
VYWDGASVISERYPMNLNRVFGPKNLPTPEQLEKMNSLRKLFSALVTGISETVPSNPYREKAFELLRDALDQVELARDRPGVLTPNEVANAFATVEAEDKRVLQVWMNAYSYADIRKFGRDIFESETSADSLKQGLMGKAWGAEFRVSRTIPTNVLLLVAQGDPEFDPTGPLTDKRVYRF